MTMPAEARIAQFDEPLLLVVGKGFGIIEQYSRLGCLFLVERQLILLLLIVEVDFTVEWGDLRRIFRIQWVRLLDNRNVVTRRGHLSPLLLSGCGNGASIFSKPEFGSRDPTTVARMRMPQ
jgi:hypothetical protein